MLHWLLLVQGEPVDHGESSRTALDDIEGIEACKVLGRSLDGEADCTSKGGHRGIMACFQLLQDLESLPACDCLEPPFEDLQIHVLSVSRPLSLVKYFRKYLNSYVLMLG